MLVPGGKIQTVCTQPSKALESLESQASSREENCVAEAKIIPLHASIDLGAFSCRQPRTSADSYVKLPTVSRLDSTYPLMLKFSVLTVPSLGKSGSAVKKAPVIPKTRNAKRQSEWHSTTSKARRTT
jgi:hypothetical protein